METKDKHMDMDMDMDVSPLNRILSQVVSQIRWEIMMRVPDGVREDLLNQVRVLVWFPLSFINQTKDQFKFQSHNAGAGIAGIRRHQ